MTLLDWFFHHEPEDSPARSAPPTGCKYALFVDPLAEHFPINGSAFQEIVTNSDDTVSFKTKSGQYLSQEPLQRGVFHLAGSIGPYEKFGMSGTFACSWTRPEAGDPIYTYVVGRLPNAA